MNWDNYKFHCSSLGNLLTSGRGKGEVMGKTCKSELQKIWMRHTWEFHEIISTEQMDKGNVNEQEAIDMVDRKYYDGKTLVKNNSLYENDFICGTPDVIVPSDRKVHDTKCSWNLRTFMDAELTKGYHYQLMGYGWKLGFEDCQLDYCLTSASPDTIARAEMRLAYKLGAEDHTDTPEFQKLANQLYLNMNFDRIPESKRVKSFKFQVEQSFIDLVKERAPIWREYLSNIKL